MMRPCCISYSLLFVLVGLAGLTNEAQAQLDVFNDYWVQPEVYSLPGAPNPPTVDSKGDLHLQIPLLTVPGRGGLDYPIGLSYTAGIKVRQEASWVGLGWEFNPGSVTRDPQGGAIWRSGGDNLTFNVDFPGETNTFLPDAYYVSIPGHGTVPFTFRDGFMPAYPDSEVQTHYSSVDNWERGFAPLEWRPWVIFAEESTSPIEPDDISNADMGKTGRIVQSQDFEPRNDYLQFVVTTEDGTRYVFARPTLASFNGVAADNTGPLPLTEYYISAWRLVAILGADYDDDNGNALVPDPSTDPAGSWVVLKYGGVQTYIRDDQATSNCTLAAPLIQKIYLRQIITPTHKAIINDGEFEAPMGGCEPYLPGEPYPDEALTSVELYHRETGQDVFVRSVELEYDESMFHRYEDVETASASHRRGLTAINFKNSAGEEEPGYAFQYATPNPDPDDLLDPYLTGNYDPEDDFGFYTARAVGAYEDRNINDYPPDLQNDNSGPLLRGRYDSGADTPSYPESSAWSLTSVDYPSGITESYTYEHDIIDAGKHSPGPGLLDEDVEVAIPHARVYGSSNSPFATTGGMYYFRCTTNCQIGPDDYRHRGMAQGGIRVKEIAREAAHLPDQVSSYKYYRSMPSGIPHSYFQRIAQEAGSYYNSASRGGAAVYYEGITRTDSPSETITTSYYTTPLLPGALTRYNRTTALRWNGQVQDPNHLTVVSDNQSRLWGREWKRLVEQRPMETGDPPNVVEVPYSYSMSHTVQRNTHKAGRQILPQVQFDRVRYDGQGTDTSHETIHAFWGYADDLIARADTSYINGGNVVGTKTIYLRDWDNLNVPSDFVTGTIVIRPDRERALMTERTYAYDIPAYADLHEAGVLTPVVREDVYEVELSGELARGVSAPDLNPTHRFFSSDADSLLLFGPAANDNSTSGREFGDVDVDICEVEEDDLLCIEPWGLPGDDGDDSEPVISSVEYHRSSVTTWQDVQGQNPPAWKPYRSYQWIAPTASVDRPDFTAWTGVDPDPAWKLQEEFEEYDAHGRAVKVRNADGGWVRLTYGGPGSASLTDIEAGEPGLIIGDGENSLGQSFAYGSIGQLVSRTDENNHTWRYRYDEGGRLYETADPLGRVTESIAYKLEGSQSALRFVETVTYPNGNLLANGSFEAYEAGSTNSGLPGVDDSGEPIVDAWDVAALNGGVDPLETGTPVLGRRALKLEPGEYAEQTVDFVEDGQELVFSCWVKGNGTPSVRLVGAHISEIDYSPGLTPVAGLPGTSYTYATDPVPASWTRYWVHLQADASGPVTVRLTADGSWSSGWDAVSLTPVPAGLTGEELQDAVRPRAAVAFADEAGTVLQTVDADSWYLDAEERVSAIDIDYPSTTEIDLDGNPVTRYDSRIVTSWLPYETNTGSWAAGVYDENAATNAGYHYDSNGPGANANGEPFTTSVYYPGGSEHLLRVRPPGAAEGTEFSEHRYRPRRIRVKPGEYLLLNEEETTDLDERHTVTYSDMNGDPILTHSFASIPGNNINVPEDIDIDEDLEGSGDPVIGDREFTATVTQYVPYDLTLAVNDQRKASARFSVIEVSADGDTETLAFERIANYGVGDTPDGGSVRISGGFIVFAGLDYKINIDISNNQIWDDPPVSSIMGTVRFKNDDGSVPMLIRTRFVRDALGQVTAVESPNAFAPPGTSNAEHWVTTYNHNTAGQMVLTTSPDAGTVHYAYDGAGRLRYSQDANQAEAQTPKVMAYCYDGLGRLLRQGLMDESNGGFIAHDPDGDCPPVADVDWHLVNRYDDGGDLTVAPFEATSEVISAVSSPSANTTGKLVASAYRSDDVWQASFFTYDALGNLAQQWTRIDGVDPEWQSTAYTYDAVGNVTEERVEVGAQALTQFYTYDGRGQLHRVYAATDGADSATERPTEPDVEYAYDVRGALVHTALGGPAGAAVTEVARAYDVRGRLTDIGDVEGSQTPWTGEGPAPPSHAAPFAARLQYSPAGLIERATALSPYAVQGSTLGPGAIAPLWQYRFSYDTMGRLTGADHFAATDFATLSGTSVAAQTFGVSGLGYDANGNLLTLTRRAPTPTATNGTKVDELLVNGTEPGYTYETGTNRLSAVYDASSEDVGLDAKPSTFDYDANGNLTEQIVNWNSQLSTTSYPAYDDRNLPLAVEVPDGEGGVRTWRYRYDTAGQRTLRWSEEADGSIGVSERYVRGASNSIAGLFDDSAGGVEYWNIRGPGGGAVGRIPSLNLVLMLRNQQDVSGTHEAVDRVDAEAVTVESGELLVLRAGSEVVLGPGFEAALGTTVELETGIELEVDPRHYYVADHLGSVRAVVQATGEMVEARDFYPFGLEMPGRVWVSGTETREGFTGHELDVETGHYYAGARYYMPALGRWTSVDPLADEFPSWSPYNYVMNNPVSMFDPTGMAPACDPPGSCGGMMMISAKTIEFATRVLQLGDTVLGLSDAVEAPSRIADGMSEFATGVWEGDISRTMEGQQEVLGGAGDIAGFVENVSLATAILAPPTAKVAGPINVAAGNAGLVIDGISATLSVLQAWNGDISNRQAGSDVGWAVFNGYVPIRVNSSLRDEIQQATESLIKTGANEAGNQDDSNEEEN